MEVYEAIKKMKIMSEKGIPFSVSFMSYSYVRDLSHGMTTIEHAKLRSANRLEHNRFRDYMLNFVDLDTLENKSCWQILLMEFNGEMLELI